MYKSLIIRSILIGFAVPVALYGIMTPQVINANLKDSNLGLSQSTLIKNGHLTICKIDKSLVVVRTIKMVVTAYSSDVWQTDSTPDITASGMHVADGIAANNLLPFGTKFRMPELYGDKVFTIEDRMNKKKGIYQADIWFPTYKQAKNFGAKVTDIEVLEN